jgi:RHH-type proline utilization regulon transcriptional repressor/proline dehydrogenase/delta 1-pyrroline-5-carboxylate dehydrogenase
MGDPEKRAVTDAGWRLRVYMPYGQLVPGMAYLVRRLLENSSNESFLRAGFVQHVPPEVLLAAPHPAVEETGNSDLPREAATAGLPGFRNEPLTDFSLAGGRRAMEEALRRFRAELERDGAALVPVVIDGQPARNWPTTARHDPSSTGSVSFRLIHRASVWDGLIR